MTEKISPTLPITPATSHATRAVRAMDQVVDAMTTGGGYSGDRPLSGTPEVTAILARLALITRDTERALALAGTWMEDRTRRGVIRPSHAGSPDTVTAATAAVLTARGLAETLTATLDEATEQTRYLVGGFVAADDETPSPR